MQIQTESKLKPLFLENPFDKALNALEVKNSKSQHQTKLDQMFSPKTFKERWEFVNKTAIMVGFICNYFSFVTAFALIFYLFFLSISPITGTFGAVIISLFPSLGLTISIELVKRHASSNFLQDAVQFKKIRAGMLSFLVISSLFSIGTSYYGAKELPKHFSSTGGNIHFAALYKLDSVQNIVSSQYDKEIAAQNIRIDSFELANTSSKGSIRYGALTTQEILQNELTELKREKRQALAKISAKYETDKTKALALDLAHQEAEQAKNSKNSNALALAAIICELLFFICMVGHWVYSWKSYQEIHLEHGTSNDSHLNDNRNDTIEEIEQEQPHQRTGIGFKKYNDSHLDDNRKDDNRNNLPTCKHCDKEFLPNHHKQVYCEEQCRIEAWQQRTNKTFTKKIKTQ